MNKNITLNTEKSNTRKAQSFAAGAFVMTIGMIIVKIAGAAFKIPLAYILGGVGTGYFNAAYSIYNPIYAFATAGLPIAISRMVASNVALGRYRDVKRIHKISIPLFLTTGLIGLAVMIFGASFYANITNSPGSIYSIFMLAPTVLFSCLIAIYKGYFEGLRNMVPTAVSEIVEAIGKVVFGLSISWVVTKYGMQQFYNKGTVFGVVCDSATAAHNAILPFSAAGAVLGITLGAVAGFVYIFVKYKISGDGISEAEIESSHSAHDYKTLFKMLLSISIPIALSAIVMNLAGAIDSTLVQMRLHDIMQIAPDVLLKEYQGLIPQQVIKNDTTHIFLAGCFGYMSAVTMVLPTITQGFAISALPNVTAAWVDGVKEKIKKSIETILKITAIVSFPAGLGLSVLSHPIMDLIYNTFGKNKQLGEIFISAEIMTIYALGMMLTAVSTPICSMLQAIGRADLPLKILTCAMAIKIACNYVLVGIPQINIQGAGVGTLACYLFVCVSALILLCKHTKIKLDWINIFVKPFLCAVMCATAAYASNGLLGHIINKKIATIVAIMIAVIVYAFTLLLFGLIKAQDLDNIPKLKKFKKILEKYKLIR